VYEHGDVMSCHGLYEKNLVLVFLYLCALLLSVSTLGEGAGAGGERRERFLRVVCGGISALVYNIH
jgi:hypothetical protein